MDTDKYNGWTNRATWCVHLWLSNTEPDYRHWREVCANAADAYHAGEQMLAHFRDAAPDRVRGMFLDLLDSVFDSVNWTEIARALRD